MEIKILEWVEIQEWQFNQDQDLELEPQEVEVEEILEKEEVMLD